MTDAGDRIRRLEVLRSEIGADRAGNDCQSAAAILGHEHRVCRAAELAGAADAEPRRGDRPCVGHLDRRVEEIESFQEKRAFLGIEDRKSLIDRDLRDVGLDLGKIRIDGGVDGIGGCWRPLHIEALARAQRLVGERRAEVALRQRGLLRGDIGSGDQVPRFRQARQADDRMRVADEAIRPARNRRTMEGVSEIARIVPPDEDVPGLGIRFRITERRERDPEFGTPACRVDLRGGVIEEIGREVFVAVGVVEDSVALDAARTDAELQGRSFVISRVEKDGDVVVRAEDVVALDVRGADLLRLRVIASNADVEILVVIGQVGDGLHFRRRAVARRILVEAVDRSCVAPSRIVQAAVDRDRLSPAVNLDGCRWWWRICVQNAAESETGHNEGHPQCRPHRQLYANTGNEFHRSSGARSAYTGARGRTHVECGMLNEVRIFIQHSTLNIEH